MVKNQYISDFASLTLKGAVHNRIMNTLSVVFDGLRQGRNDRQVFWPIVTKRKNATLKGQNICLGQLCSTKGRRPGRFH